MMLSTNVASKAARITAQTGNNRKSKFRWPRDPIVRDRCSQAASIPRRKPSLPYFSVASAQAIPANKSLRGIGSLRESRSHKAPHGQSGASRRTRGGLAPTFGVIAQRLFFSSDLPFPSFPSNDQNPNLEISGALCFSELLLVDR